MYSNVICESLFVVGFFGVSELVAVTAAARLWMCLLVCGCWAVAARL